MPLWFRVSPLHWDLAGGYPSPHSCEGPCAGLQFSAPALTPLTAQTAPWLAGTDHIPLPKSLSEDSSAQAEATTLRPKEGCAMRPQPQAPA